MTIYGFPAGRYQLCNASQLIARSNGWSFKSSGQMPNRGPGNAKTLHGLVGPEKVNCGSPFLLPAKFHDAGIRWSGASADSEAAILITHQHILFIITPLFVYISFPLLLYIIYSLIFYIYTQLWIVVMFLIFLLVL